MQPSPSPLLPPLNPEQRAAVLSADMRLLVLAGGEAGKTKALNLKILYLIFEQHEAPSAILAITVTRSAADGMVDRLIAHFRAH
jgi:DNA helicase-4